MENIRSMVVQKEAKSKFRYDYFIFALLAFFMGQADLAFGIYPFSLVYWSLFVGLNNYLLLFVSLSTSAGLIYAGGIEKLSYCAGFIGLLLYKLYCQKFKAKEWVMILFISISFLITSFAVNYFNNALLYRYLLNTAESILIFMFILIVRKGSRNISFSKKSLTNLEKLTVLLLSIAFLLGLVSIPYYGIIINILIMLIIIGATYATGINPGLLLAVIYGLVFVSTGVIPMVTMVKYIIFALISALFVHKKRKWMIISFLLAFLLYSGFSPSMYDIKMTLIETGIVLAIFLVIPPYIWDYIFKRFTDREQKLDEKELNKRYERDFKQQLNELSVIFSELSATFEEVLPDERIEKNNRLEDFIFIFKNKNCKKCSGKRRCWYQKRKQSYKVIKNMLIEAREKGKITREICDRYLGKICRHTDEILPGVKSSFELFQVNNFWRNRLIEKQKSVSDQLEGIGNIVEEFSYNSGVGLNYELPLDKIKNKLTKNNIDVHDITINGESKSHRLSVNMKIEPCRGNEPCLNKILNTLNSEFEYNFRLLTRKCGNILKERPCHLHYGPAGIYTIDQVAIQRSVKEEISGDTLLYKKLTYGEDLIVLSDGMGIGQKAADESKAAVNLFKNIIEAGFNQKLAIKTINSVLFLRNQEERFTTMDIAFFNTFNGKLKTKKIGAMSTYIKRGWEIIDIQSSSLPAGILERIEASSSTVQLKEDDFVFMLSDGILDAMNVLKDREEWFKQLLQKISFTEPGDYADYIMEVINKHGKIDDDMSIVVFKVKKEF